MKTKFIYSCLLASIFLVNSCVINPVTGKKQLVLMSEEQEIAMGKDADPQIVAQYGLYENKALQDFITQKGKEMAAISHRPNLNYEFKILDSEVLNAFAVPGGYVYFTRGIMAHFNNEAEFAGVLGHEIGHITARHSVSQQTKAVLGQVGLIGSMILVPQVAEFAEPLSQGLGLLFLKFGRDAERQSDELGVEYSSKIGYDAREMAGFFNTLERKSSGVEGGELPDFLYPEEVREVLTESWAELFLIAVLAKGSLTKAKKLWRMQAQWIIDQETVLKGYGVLTPLNYAWRYTVGRREVMEGMGLRFPAPSGDPMFVLGGSLRFTSPSLEMD